MAKPAKKGYYTHDHDGQDGSSCPMPLSPAVTGIAWDDHYDKGSYFYFKLDYLTPGYDQFDSEFFTKVESPERPDGSIETDGLYIQKYYSANHTNSFSRNSFIHPETGELVVYNEENRADVEQDLTYRGLAEFDVSGVGGRIDDAVLNFTPDLVVGPEPVKVDLFLYKADGTITNSDFGAGVKAGSIILDGDDVGQTVKVDLNERVIDKILKHSTSDYIGVNFRVDLDDPNFSDDIAFASTEGTFHVERSTISLDLFYA
jgi:hypothetical protein